MKHEPFEDVRAPSHWIFVLSSQLSCSLDFQTTNWTQWIVYIRMSLVCTNRGIFSDLIHTAILVYWGKQIYIYIVRYKHMKSMGIIYICNLDVYIWYIYLPRWPFRFMGDHIQTLPAESAPGRTHVDYVGGWTGWAKCESDSFRPI